MTLWEFLARHSGELAGLIFEHLLLVVVSTGIAIMIGVPLGVLLTRKPALSKPVLGFANIMQTVPSLALSVSIPLTYTFSLKDRRHRARTSIVALVLYALFRSFAYFSRHRNVAGDPRRRPRHCMTDAVLFKSSCRSHSCNHRRHSSGHGDLRRHGAIAQHRCRGLGRYIFRGLRANYNMLILPAVPRGADRHAAICCLATSSARYIQTQVQLEGESLFGSGVRRF